jgi:hypothetical protein
MIRVIYQRLAWLIDDFRRRVTVEPVSKNVSSGCHGGWEHFRRTEKPPYEITGKYLFFSTDRSTLVKIAIEALENDGFHHAKITADKDSSSEYVLCLYDQDDSRKHELAGRYRNLPNLRFRYWKSNTDTHKGKYSKKFLDGISPKAPSADWLTVVPLLLIFIYQRIKVSLLFIGKGCKVLTSTAYAFSDRSFSSPTQVNSLDQLCEGG